MSKFYVTTAIPYVNGKPHIGHALEYFQADTVRAYHELLGDKTLLLSGADENALKNVQAAEKEGVPVQEFLDKSSEVWRKAYEKLGVHLDVFQRGSDTEKHWPGVQKLWALCEKNGDIYKKSYSGLYCVGCESFKVEKELVNSLCPEHQKKPEVVQEENYFFKLSKYQEELITLIDSNELHIIPDNKKQEALSFIKAGLEDFSISRSKERAKGVGVPIPNDPEQVMYVWFDALNIYMTGVGFGINEEKWKTWWPADLHIIGKDINRFHTVYWPAMLLAANLPLPKSILIHGFIYVKGEKMSKSVGNVVDPFELAQKYGIEPLRYYLLSQVPRDSDADFTFERFIEVYNSDLANGLGNLVARVAKLCEKIGLKNTQTPSTLTPDVEKLLSEYKFNEALAQIWKQITTADRYVNETKPWTLEEKELEQVLTKLVTDIKIIAYNLTPFLPDTSKKILKQLSGNIISSPSLFPRLQTQS